MIAYNLKWMILALSMASFCMSFAGCQKKHTPELWPGNAVRKKLTDYVINPSEQIVLLRQADAQKNAKDAYRRGDLRLIGDRQALPRFWGVPDNATTQLLIKRYSYKILAFTPELLENVEFRALKLKYEEAFNKTLYELYIAKNVKEKGS